jgi:prophage DNA circulation protein
MSGTYWSENLLGAELGGVAFEPESRRVENARDFTRYRYPYRTGQGVEDLGRKPVVFTITVPLFSGVRTSDYPGTADKLLELVQNETHKGELEYIDPEYGAFDVKIVSHDWSVNASERNGGHLTLVLEERDFGQDLLQNMSSGKLAARGLAAKAAASADYLIDTVFVTDELEPPEDGFSLTEAWAKVQDALDSAALSADSVAAYIDEYVSVATKALNFSPSEEIARWTITNAVYDAIGFAFDVGDDAATGELGDKFTEVVLPDELSIYEIAQRYYGDASRAEDVAFHNSFVNPMLVPRGTTILVAP